jgi:C-terminal processing protease CtpA/Prc/Leucine-rich repeat (LRR) protein
MFKKKTSASEDVTLQVVVPNNAKPGDQLKVKVPGGGDAIITIPPESIPSTRITVKVNSSSVINNPTQKPIVYKFQKGPLGISLEEKKNENGSLIVFIATIKDGSAASTFPTLSPGDILVGVAGKPVKNATMDDALKMIKSSPRPVDLEFMKPAVAGSIDTTIVNSDSNGTDVNSNSNQPFETNTYTVRAGSIGITLEEAMENNISIVYVAAVASGSQAEKFSTLAINDILLAVNGEDISKLSLSDATALIARSSRPLSITFRKKIKKIQSAKPGDTSGEAIVDVKTKEFVFQAGSIGIVINERNNNVKYVDQIHPGSQASNFGTLLINDTLVAVNGQNVESLSLKDAMAIISKSPRPLKLGFRAGTAINESISEKNGKITFAIPDHYKVEKDTMEQLDADFKQKINISNKKLKRNADQNIIAKNEEDEDQFILDEVTTEEKIFHLLRLPPVIKYPLTYYDSNHDIDMTVHSNDIFDTQIKTSMHLNTRARGRMKSLIAMDASEQRLGTWDRSDEIQRRNKDFLSYIPSYFLRRRLKKYDDYDDGVKVTDLKEAKSHSDKDAILFAWITNAKFEANITVGVLNALKNIEVLTLRNADLTSTAILVLPNLLYCDISYNRIADIEGIKPLYLNSQYLQCLDFRQNPIVDPSNWIDSMPPVVTKSRGKRKKQVKITEFTDDWKILIKFPDLVILNGNEITFAQQNKATAQFGGIVAQKRLNLRRWDKLLSKSFPELLHKEKWMSNQIKIIIMTSQRLKTFHVGSFQSLQTLDLSNNMIESIKYCGLENCVNLWALNLENNRLNDKEEIKIFGMIPALRALFLVGNPFHDARLTSDYRFKVIYYCRNLRGSNTHSGLLLLDGHQSSLEEKINAMIYETGDIDEEEEAQRGGCCSCFGSSKKAQTTPNIQIKRDLHTDFQPSDRYRLRLLLEQKYGCHALATGTKYENIMHLSLPQKGILAMDLNLFGVQLISVNLSNNFLSSIIGLESHLKLRHLNIAGNGSDSLIENARPQILKLVKLRSLSICKSANMDDAAIRQLMGLTLKWLCKTHHHLGVIENLPVSINDHVKIRTPEGTSEDNSNKYALNLAIQFSYTKLESRNYDYYSNNHELKENPNNEKVISLLHSCQLGLQNAVLKLEPLVNLKILNLAGNNLTTIVGLGFEKLINLKCLDLKNNNIDDTFDVFGGIINKLELLEILAIKGNPFFKIEGKKRRGSVMGNTPSKKKNRCGNAV